MMIQVYGVYTIQGSVLMFLGIAIFSPMIAIAQWLGAILACFTGLFLILYTLHLSSPQPKGLRAESTRAFTGRRNSHSGRGEDFLTSQPDFFYGNSCNSGTESRKIVSKVGN